MSNTLINKITKYVLNRRWLIVLGSMLLSLLTISFDKYHYYSSSRLGLGIPLNYFYFIGNKIPDTRLQMLLPENIIRIQFRLDIFTLNIVIIYIVIKYLVTKISKLNELQV